MPFLWRCTLRIRPLAAPHALGPFSSIRASSGDPVPNDTLMSCVLKYIMIVVYNWQCSKFCSRLSTFTSVSRAAAAAQWPTSATIFHSSLSFRFFFSVVIVVVVLCAHPQSISMAVSSWLFFQISMTPRWIRLRLWLRFKTSCCSIMATSHTSLVDTVSHIPLFGYQNWYNELNIQFFFC